MGHPQFFCGRPAGEFSALPGGFDLFVAFATIFKPSAKMNALCFRRRNALGLSLPVELPLGLSHIAQKLEYDVGDEDTGQIPALSGIQTVQWQ